LDLKDKIVSAFMTHLKPEYIRLEDDDGISGFVVSSNFKDMPTFDRQGLIENVLQKAPLDQAEHRRVLMIAALTPVEYESVGARIRVHKVREIQEGVLEILLHGGSSDAEYVRGALGTQKGVKTSTPTKVEGANGILMSFTAERSGADPLTKANAIQVLQADPYIQVVPAA
jgi:hypothetical protein